MLQRPVYPPLWISYRRMFSGLVASGLKVSGVGVQGRRVRSILRIATEAPAAILRWRAQQGSMDRRHPSLNQISTISPKASIPKPTRGYIDPSCGFKGLVLGFGRKVLGPCNSLVYTDRSLNSSPKPPTATKLQLKSRSPIIETHGCSEIKTDCAMDFIRHVWAMIMGVLTAKPD